MRKKKIIAYRDERIKKIAVNLRKLLVNIVFDEDIRLGNIHFRFLKQRNKQEAQSIQEQRNELLRALEESICMCPGCRKSDKDMIFNPFVEKWWCAPCYQEMKDAYLNDKSFFEEEGEEEYYKTFTL